MYLVNEMSFSYILELKIAGTANRVVGVVRKTVIEEGKVF